MTETEKVAELMEPTILDSYRGITPDGPVTVNLTWTEKTAILRAYDPGLQALTETGKETLYSALVSLKRPTCREQQKNTPAWSALFPDRCR